MGFVGEKTSGQTIFLASPNKNGAFWKTFLRTRPKWQVLNSLASFRVKGMATLRHRVYLSTSKNSHCSCHSRATQIKRRSLPNSVYTFLKQHIGYPNNGWLNDALLYFQAQKMIQATSFQEVRWFFYLSTITEIMRMMVVNNPFIRPAVSGGWHWGGVLLDFHETSGFSWWEGMTWYDMVWPGGPKIERMERLGEGGMDIGLSFSHCGDVGEPCLIDELSCNHLVFIRVYSGVEYIWGFPKMVVPNNPMGFPSKNDHFGVWNGGTTI